MPTSVWECELSFDGYTYTPTPDAGAPDPDTGDRIGWWWVGLEAICLPLLDDLPKEDPTLDAGGFYLFTGYSDGTSFFFPSPGVFQGVTVRLGSAPTVGPAQWPIPFLLTPLTGGSAALLSGSVTLSITKDYDGNLMTFTGPMGTQTVSLTDIDALPGGPYGYHNTTPLRPRGYVERHLHPEPTFTDPAYDIDDEVSYYNLIGKENGVAYDTVALSSGDPGLWWPTFAAEDIPGVGTVRDVGLAPNWVFNQLPTRQQYQGSILTTGYPAWTSFFILRRRMSVSNAASDMIQVREHGAHYAAVVYAADPTTVTFRQSYDDAATWVESALFTDGATNNKSPSLIWHKGRLHAIWYNGTNIVQSQSQTLGAAWETPVTLSITGTNPRVIIDQHHGIAFYFSVDGSGNLLLQRSGNYGTDWIDAAPITVATGVGQQTVVADFTAGRSLIVGYITAGAWTQKKSNDYGVNWS